MSQESDTPNDSKPMRLKLSGNTPEGNKESAEKNPSTEPKSDSENATEKKASSFKKAEPKSSDSETADGHVDVRGDVDVDIDNVVDGTLRMCYR